MPFVIHPRGIKRLRRIAALSAIGMMATTGVASAATCPTSATTTPFAHWGDTSSYFLAAGGSFEGTASQVGWTLSGASLTAGNEPFALHAASDSQSLTIKGGGTATSPYMCLDSSMPFFRFVARQSAAGSDLKVTALVKTSSSSSAQTYSIVDLANGSMPSWAPTGRLASAWGLTVPAGIVVQAALRFQAPVSSGSWQIDDVYIDPYRAG